MMSRDYDPLMHDGPRRSESERAGMSDRTKQLMNHAAITPGQTPSRSAGIIYVNLKKAELKMKHLIYQTRHDELNGGISGLSSTSTLTPGDSQHSNLRGLLDIVVFDPISVMLFFWPLGLAAHFLHWGDGWCFVTNFLAMVPLAKILGDATEELAAGLKNDTVGGLLNATFGNAVEMILTVQMLRDGKVEVVKGTLLGSILSNILLVLGMSFFAGGLTLRAGEHGDESSRLNQEQKFSSSAALTNMTMLFMATCAFALPTVFFETLASHNGDSGLNEGQQLEITISRWCSLYILSAYIAFLAFQLYTHVDMFSGGDPEAEEEAQLKPWAAMLLLFVTTCFVAFTSELLVDSIDGIVERWNIGSAFIGVILLPIVGNACEHAGAVRMAIYDKVDITIGIAVGSSTQIALFVVPFSVLVGWFIGVGMDLDLGSLNVVVLMFAVLICFSILSDGNSNWLEGYMLMISYAVVATLYWFVPEGAVEAAATAEL